MMRILQNIFFGIIALTATMVIVSFFLPEKYTVEKSIHINAPVDIVFQQINDLKNWKDWSYFANLDPTWKTDFGNWTFGKDAALRWESEKLGNGQLKIIESIPNKKILVHFDYDESGKGGDALYFFKRENDGTTATFRLEFPVPLTPQDKFENIFFEKENSEPQFEYSLKHLKGVSERKFKEKLNNG
ncbi:MAG: SRPBCC family protein [Saprospiraceae bacterium]